jgi:outer membrane lipoprotein SlyB
MYFKQIALVFALTLSGCTSGNAASMSSYTPSKQDKEILLALGEVPEKGMEYIRCYNQYCYSIATGVYAGKQSTDGIYLVWPAPEYPPLIE